LEKSEKILAFAQRQFSHHVSPRIHHVLTIKKPRSTPRFSQNPLKKPSKKRKNPTAASADFSSKSKNEAKHSA
jgi:hypothetical protein